MLPLEFLWVVFLVSVFHLPLVVPLGLTCPLTALLMPHSSYVLPFSWMPCVVGLCLILATWFCLGHKGWGHFSGTDDNPANGEPQAYGKVTVCLSLWRVQIF